MKRTNILLMLFTFFFIQSHCFGQGLDLFGDEDEEVQDEQPDPYKLDIIKEMLANTGAVGVFPANAISSYNMVNEGCDATYICMYNTLKKVYKIYQYELALSPKGEKLECSREKEILQDYSLFLLTLNLDLYCVEQLHPDGNELEDAELINAMMAMADVWALARVDGHPLISMLAAYIMTRETANPYCSEDLMETQEIDGIISATCDCGDFSGTLDLAKKNKILKDIRTMLDDINPIWQAAKAVEINQRLKALPCK